MRKSVVSATFITLLLASSISGAVTSGTKVTLKFPKRMLKMVSTSGWTGHLYGVEVVCDGPACTVNGQKDWQTSGFPWLIEGTVGRSLVDKKTKNTMVEVNIRKGPTLRLVFPNAADVDRGMAAVVLGPNESPDAYRAAIYQEIAKTLFSGQYATVPAESQSRLMAFADSMQSPLSSPNTKTARICRSTSGTMARSTTRSR